MILNNYSVLMYLDYFRAYLVWFYLVIILVLNWLVCWVTTRALSVESMKSSFHHIYLYIIISKENYEHFCEICFWCRYIHLNTLSVNALFYPKHDFAEEMAKIADLYSLIKTISPVSIQNITFCLLTNYKKKPLFHSMK